MWRILRTFGRVTVGGGLLLSTTTAHAQVPVDVRARDACVFVDHGNSGSYTDASGVALTTPSIIGIDISFDNFQPFGPAERYVVEVVVDGPGGPLAGTAALALDGRARVPIGIETVGSYTPVGAVITDQNNAAYTIDLSPVWTDPFVVDANEVTCDFDTLTTGAPADIDTETGGTGPGNETGADDTTPSGPTTSAASVTDDTDGSAAAAATTNDDADSDGPPWIPIIVAGGAVTAAGVFLVMRNRHQKEAT